ncbi:MFS transporter [Virgisporangium aliadipatigenens]|uniref:MFS transporter n=1 Tax=Virgisporangium aliadipatigenens TaxID=741659 RepID=A0A8J3YUZ7_9ACTN|nr:MFS transporter [Virgisporangium aliadipatigenens]GIJ52036.1 MFS transporter [Virgisporangium aliadipatigenens]
MGTAAARWVLLATVLGSSLVMLDSTVVNVALPRLGEELDADFAGLQWVVNGYTLTLAALILLGGSLGDRYGRRRVFVIGVVWFALASALCGLAPTVELLTAGRALQGIGGALLTPGSLAIIAASFDPEDRSRAVGAWSALGGVAGAVGPFAGGFLVEWNWRAVFLVNVPLAVVVVLVAVRHVPESKDPAASHTLDLPGSALAAAGLGLLTYGLIASSVWISAAGVAVLGGFVAWQRHTAHPLVPLDLFGNRRFTAINVVTFAVYAAIGVFFFLLVLNLQVVAGFAPVPAGAAVLPVTVLMLLLSARVGALSDRVGPRVLLSAGLLVAAFAVVLASRIGAGATYLGSVLPAVVLFGLGLSLVVAPLTATVLNSVSGGHAGVASGVNNAVARAAGLLAVAVVPVAAGISGDDYTQPSSFAAGFRTAMLISAALLTLGAGLAWALLRQPAAVPASLPPADPVGAAGSGEPAGPAREPAPVGVAPSGEGGTEPLDVSRCIHCGVTAPQLHPR